MRGSQRSLFSAVREADHIAIKGSIDESAKLADLVAQATDKKLVLDLGAVSFMNSIGVREWVRLQQAALAGGITLELRRVAEVLIHQLNIVPAARGASTVTSFFAPYLCEHCDDQHGVLLDVATHHASLVAMQPPPASCPSCKRSMTFCDPPELYFSFLSGTSPLR